MRNSVPSRLLLIFLYCASEFKMVGGGTLGNSSNNNNNNDSINNNNSNNNIDSNNSNSNDTNSTSFKKGTSRFRHVFGHNLSQTFSVVTATCFLLIMIGSFVFNSLLILTILKVEKLHTIMHVLVVNMAISDLTTALGVIPFDAEYMLRGYFPHNYVSCGVTGTFFFMSLPSSVYSLLSITAERYLTIVYPTKKYITKRVVFLWLTSSWCYIFLVALFPLMYDENAVRVIQGNCFLMFPVEYQFFQVVLNFLIPIILIMLMYAKLFKISYKQANKTARMAIKIGKMDESASSSGLLVRNENKESKHPIRRPLGVVSSLLRNMKALKRITLLITVLILCWFSYIIIVILNYHCLCHPRELTWMANVINYSSSVLNPIVYGVFDSTLRTEMMKILNAIRRIFEL